MSADDIIDLYLTSFEGHWKDANKVLAKVWEAIRANSDNADEAIVVLSRTGRMEARSADFRRAFAVVLGGRA